MSVPVYYFDPEKARASSEAIKALAEARDKAPTVAFLPAFRSVWKQANHRFRSAFSLAATESTDPIRRAAYLSEYTYEELTGSGRQAGLVRVRWAVMRAFRKRGWSTPEIGAALGNRDHTTVLHGLKRADELYRSDATFRKICDQVGA